MLDYPGSECLHDVIHTTGFGTDERSLRSIARAAEARRRIVDYLLRRGVPAVVLTSPAAVAWVTGGFGPPIDRGASSADAWVVLSQSAATVVTTVVERERLLRDYAPSAHGFELVAVDWHDPEALPRACADIAGIAPQDLVSDGHPMFGSDHRADLVELRLALSSEEQADMRDLGGLTAHAIGDALRSWQPGKSTDRDIQAAIAERLEAEGADTPVLIVGGDERVRRLRHPVAVGAVVHELLMAVVVARRAGLHVAATRFAMTPTVHDDLRGLQERVQRIDDAVLSATVPGAMYSDVMAALGDAYANEGAAGAWREHYQGGPIGFAQREFEFAPGGPYGAHGATKIATGHAVAWNPSLAGGAKCEDTYLIDASGLCLITGDETWPSAPPAPHSPLQQRRAPLIVD